MKKISLLGATVSIGWQTFDILLAQPQAFKLVAFSAGQNIEKSREIINKIQPELVSMQTEEAALTLQKDYPHIAFTYGE